MYFVTRVFLWLMLWFPMILSGLFWLLMYLPVATLFSQCCRHKWFPTHYRCWSVWPEQRLIGLHPQWKSNSSGSSWFPQAVCSQYGGGQACTDLNNIQWIMSLNIYHAGCWKFGLPSRPQLLIWILLTGVILNHYNHHKAQLCSESLYFGISQSIFIIILTSHSILMIR